MEIHNISISGFCNIKQFEPAEAKGFLDINEELDADNNETIW